MFPCPRSAPDASSSANCSQRGRRPAPSAMCDGKPVRMHDGPAASLGTCPGTHCGAGLESLRSRALVASRGGPSSHGKRSSEHEVHLARHGPVGTELLPCSPSTASRPRESFPVGAPAVQPRDRLVVEPAARSRSPSAARSRAEARAGRGSTAGRLLHFRVARSRVFSPERVTSRAALGQIDPVLAQRVASAPSSEQLDHRLSERSRSSIFSCAAHRQRDLHVPALRSPYRRCRRARGLPEQAIVLASRFAETHPRERDQMCRWVPCLASILTASRSTPSGARDFPAARARSPTAPRSRARRRADVARSAPRAGDLDPSLTPHQRSRIAALSLHFAVRSTQNRARPRRSHSRGRRTSSGHRCVSDSSARVCSALRAPPCRQARPCRSRRMISRAPPLRHEAAREQLRHLYVPCSAISRRRCRRSAPAPRSSAATCARLREPLPALGDRIRNPCAGWRAPRGIRAPGVPRYSCTSTSRPARAHLDDSGWPVTNAWL